MYVKILGTMTTLIGILMGLGQFPQIIKIFKTKSAKDISLITYALLAVGSIIWLLYGLALNQQTIVISYLVGVIEAVGVFTLAILYRY